MDLKGLVVPFVWWTSAPQHPISCASGLDPVNGESISHLVTGSVTGEIVLWRRYVPNPESTRPTARNGSDATAIEKNIQLQVTEMKAAVSGAERFLPTAVVIGRVQSGVALSAIEIFQFRETVLFAACYVDGLICIHECLSGDNILSLPILSITVSKIRIYKNSKDEPFVMAACIPQRISTQIFIIRIGLGEGYHGIMSIVKTLDLEVPVIDAEVHLRSTSLFILTRMKMLVFDLQSLTGPRVILDLTDIAAPISATISGNWAVVFGKQYVLPLRLNDEGDIVTKIDAKLYETQLEAGILFNGGATIAIVHSNSSTVDLIDTVNFSVLHSIRLPSTQPRYCQQSVSARTIILTKTGMGLFVCGGDYLPNGTVFEISDASSFQAKSWALTDSFPRLSPGSQITASHIIGLKVPIFVAGFDSGFVRLRLLSSKYRVMEWRAHLTPITALSYIESVLFLGSSDGEISCWKLDGSPSCIARFDVHFNAVVRFVQIDDKEIAAIARDNSFSLYEVLNSTSISKKLLGIGHSSPVIRFLYDSWVKEAGFVISVTQDATIYVWISSTGALDRILKGKGAREFLQARGFTVEGFNQPSLSDSDTAFSELSNIGFDLNSKVCTINLAPVFDLISAQTMASYTKTSQSDFNLESKRSWGQDRRLNSVEFSDEGLRLIASLFIDWTLDPDLEMQLMERFGLFNPMQLIRNDLLSSLCFAMFGTASVYKDPNAQHPFSITLLLPSRWPATSRWRFSHRCTALNSLCINAIFMRLMSSGSSIDQSLCSRLLSNYGVLLPDALLFFKEPALRVLSAFSLHSIVQVHTSARFLLQSAITRMSPQKKLSAFHYWSSVFKGHSASSEAVFDDRDYENNESPSKLEFLSRNDEKLMCAMILCFLCVNHRFVLDNDIGSNLCGLLIQLIIEKADDNVRASLAADLIGKGARQWQTFLSPLDRIILQLLSLSANERGDITVSVQASARRALLELSMLKPSYFFVIIAKVLHNAKKSNERLSITALECASDLVIKSAPGLLSGQDEQLIPATLKMILNRLNPLESSMRRSIIEPAITVFKAFALKFPTVKMHPEQKVVAFVSGANIDMYDVTTASKWRSLEGHNAPVKAIAFNPDGSMIASYCAQDRPPSLRIWSLTGSSRSFMSHLLNTPLHSFRVINLAPLQTGPDGTECWHQIDLTWSPLYIQLVREDLSIHQLSAVEPE